VPTGAGKTEAALLAWLWNRIALGRRDCPRRLVYCVPMRVLVEQTADRLKRILRNLELYVEKPSQDSSGAKISFHILMGGEIDDEWGGYPERPTILIGTQDMLLSRALNRGYAMSRYRWPVQFGLLNNDALWIIDEVQLFGAGLATTAQLQAFRRQLGTCGGTATFWMSATMESSWIETVDVDRTVDIPGAHVELTDADFRDATLRARLVDAPKPLTCAMATIGAINALADEVNRAHRPASRTLVIVNTVRRAAQLYEALAKRKPAAGLVLAHSRFRPPDRRRKVERLLADVDGAGTIVVTTQVIEAGVDISATALFTELAPWPSLVQRFGRCNRRGNEPDASVRWIDLPNDENEHEGLAAPYDLELLRQARETLRECADVRWVTLPRVEVPFAHRHVVRRKDVLELFDTTPDLAGHDVDVSRFIRDTADLDIFVFWREGEPREDEAEPSRDELCPAPLADIRDLVKRRKLAAWRWDYLEERWALVRSASQIYPGLALRLRSEDGGYTEEVGWSPSSRGRVAPVAVEAEAKAERHGDDAMSEKEWQLLGEHTDRVVRATELLAGAISLTDPLKRAVLDAARWHDAGKAHDVFQRSLRRRDPANGPPGILAKSAFRRIRHDRPCFRHELASGILALMHGQDDLVAYLAAAHHGKVRLSIRSLPHEKRPENPAVRFARGVWEGDLIPGADLGGGVVVPLTPIDLSFMELGEGPRGASWLARTLALRDNPDLGPFRLAFLEALVITADWRASGGLS
jgi:CRISPR-associated endonuclease/helicase Cas3